MSKTTTQIGKELSEALNPGMEDALNERYGHLLPGMAEGVVDFAYGRQYARPELPLLGRYLEHTAFNLHHQLHQGCAFDGTFSIQIKRGVL